MGLKIWYGEWLALIFLIFDHMKTDQCRKLYQESIKLNIPALLLSVAISKQLNAVVSMSLS